MNTTDPIKALERVNGEYIRLKEYEPGYARLGRNLNEFGQAFPFHLFGWASRVLRRRALRKKNRSVSRKVKPEEMYFASPMPVEDKRGAIYTCVTNGYDDPHEPMLSSAQTDYVLFSDRREIAGDSVWQLRSADTAVAEGGVNLTNRYYKFHPHEFFGDYDYAIYIDGNVQVVSDLTGLYRVASGAPTGIAMHRHFARRCISMEVKWCEYNGRGDTEKLCAQAKRYFDEGFPKDFGMCEATVIVTDLRNPNARKLLEAWWEEYLRAEGGRDQIVFPYILWKNGFTIDDVGDLGNDEYHNPKFRIFAHKGK